MLSPIFDRYDQYYEETQFGSSISAHISDDAFGVHTTTQFTESHSHSFNPVEPGDVSPLLDDRVHSLTELLDVPSLMDKSPGSPSTASWISIPSLPSSDISSPQTSTPPRPSPQSLSWPHNHHYSNSPAGDKGARQSTHWAPPALNNGSPRSVNPQPTSHYLVGSQEGEEHRYGATALRRLHIEDPPPSCYSSPPRLPRTPSPSGFLNHSPFSSNSLVRLCSRRSTSSFSIHSEEVNTMSYVPPQYASETHGVRALFPQSSSPMLHSTSAARRCAPSATTYTSSSSSRRGVVEHVRPFTSTSRASVVLRAPPAAGVSVADRGRGQARGSSGSTALWCTLTLLRSLLMGATVTAKDLSAREKDCRTPSILLGFHQDYPVVNELSQVSYLVTWESAESGVIQQSLLTLEAPLQASNGGDDPNTFSTTFPQLVADASELLEPKACQLHLVDVLFDMARINPALAAIVDNIPVMSHAQLNDYYQEHIELIAGQHSDYGRFGERRVGTGAVVQLHVALLTAKGGSNSYCPLPPPEPVVFFTAAEAERHSPHTMRIAHPILLQPPSFTRTSLYSAVDGEHYPYEDASCPASLASVTYHHLMAVHTSGTLWHTLTHNISPPDSDVKTGTIFVTATECSSDSSASTTSASTPLVYRYLSHDLDTPSSSSTQCHGDSSLREQNIMSAVMSFIRAPQAVTLHPRCSRCVSVSPCPPLLFVVVLFPVYCSPVRCGNVQTHMANCDGSFPREVDTSAACAVEHRGDGAYASIHRLLPRQVPINLSYHLLCLNPVNCNSRSRDLARVHVG